MHPYPHHYQASARASAEGMVEVQSPGLPTMPSASPPEFDGPGGVWSPETLLMASLADCFLLTFRAIARASKLEWRSLECAVEGVLERTPTGPWFTGFTTRARLEIGPGVDAARATLLLEKAEKGCLIANSVKGERHLECEVVTAA